jgi:hypothetical protein
MAISGFSGATYRNPRRAGQTRIPCRRLFLYDRSPFGGMWLRNPANKPRPARVDPTLNCLNPTLRTDVERSLRDFKQAMSVARATMQESRAPVARSRGKPYLATDGGKPTMAVSFQSQKCSEKN